MAINLGLFADRLRRLLACEEGTLTDAAKQHIQKLYSETEIITSRLRVYEFEISWLVMQNPSHTWNLIDSPDLQVIMEEIKCFAYESENVIDAFVMGESSSKDPCDALLGLQRKFIDIKKRVQRFQRIMAKNAGLIEFIKKRAWEEKESIQIKAREKKDTLDLDNKMEELLDLLIEGQPSLSVVAVVDSKGFDKAALVEKAYNSNYVKNYFDCRAWMSFQGNNVNQILDDIMKSVMPLSMWREIMDKGYELKKTILHDYLRSKRYLFMFEYFWGPKIWNYLKEVLPDHHNGSRLLILLVDIDFLKLCRLENGENIRVDLIPTGGPLLRATYQEWPFYILYYGSLSFQESMEEVVSQSFWGHILSVSMLPLYLKACCLYFVVFPEQSEIATRQLYQLWIAQGFIPDNSEQTANKYLTELISGGFIQVKKRRYGGTIKTIYVPKMTWVVSAIMAQATEFIISVTSKNLNDASRKSCKRLSFLEYPTTFASLEHHDKYLHSLLHLNSARELVDPIDCEKIYRKFKILKLLDLGSLVLCSYPTGIEQLVHLRYLKLNIPSLKSLPSSLLCNLLKLYTLDMPMSYIDHTADDIWKMNELRYVNFGLITLPACPGKYCSSLENLNFISALHPSCCTPDIMDGLPNLRNLRICGDLSYCQSLLSKSLSRLSCLESLKLVNECKKSRLSKIFLVEYKFPPILTHLSLSKTQLMHDPMPTLEKLPHLQVLKLKQNSYFGRKLACGSGAFPKLKVLHLKSMLWLEEWTMENGAMPKLECLVINPCAYLKKLPEQLWCRKGFNKLELWWPQPDLRQKLRDFEDKELYNMEIYPNGI